MIWRHLILGILLSFGAGMAQAADYKGSHDFATSNALVKVATATNAASPVRLDQANATNNVLVGLINGKVGTNSTFDLLTLDDGSTLTNVNASGTVDHSALTNLNWTASGHTGDVSTLAAFGASGLASNVAISAFDLAGTAAAVSNAVTSLGYLTSSTGLTNGSSSVSFVGPLTIAGTTPSLYLGTPTVFASEGGLRNGLTMLDTNSGYFTLAGSGTTASIFGGGVDTDAYRRFRITAGGSVYWGVGTHASDELLWLSSRSNLVFNTALLVVSNDFTVTGVITGNGSGLTNVTATFSPTWVEAVNLTSWMTPFAGPTANSNAIAPIWIYSAATTNDVMALGGTTASTNHVQDAYREASACPPFGSTAWGGATALTIRVYASTNDPALSKIDLKVVSPSGVLFTTNALVGGNGGTFVDYYFLTNDVPSFASCVSTQSWLFRITQYLKSTSGTIIHTNGWDSIRWNVR